jgi:NADP-dependent 3-hydroxy acid dehydrogenase YdfG
LRQWYSANYSFVDKPAEATTKIMESLKNQIAVVTGASSGIGKAIALSLASQAAEVCLVARRRELLEDVAKQIHALGSRGHACPADITRDDDIRGLGERFQKDSGHVNILELCGGAIFHGPLENASLADFDLMYRSNVRGHYLMIQTMLLLLRKSKGQIVFINSSAGLRSSAAGGQFAATQHAFRSIADSLRDEGNALGIRVLSVYPGRTATPRIAIFSKRKAAPTSRTCSYSPKTWRKW